MSLRLLIDPLYAFDVWIKNNPKGGIFEFRGQKFRVFVRDVHNCT
jgi:hypothetical protein